MKVKEIMTRGVQVIHPDDTVRMAAEKMRDRDMGFLPVCDGDRLMGVITDRDLVVRGAAQGMSPDASIGSLLMSTPVIYCYEDEDVRDAAKRMQAHQVRRMAVLSRGDKRLVGVLSLGDVATNEKRKVSGKVLEKVSQ